MAVESVEIVLNGVDNASPVVDKVTQKLISNEEKYISKLKEQFIAQTQGAEAAERFKLAEMGFSEAAIESAVALKQQIEAAKEAARAAEQLAEETRKAAEAQEELQAGPSFSESATEFSNSMAEGLGRMKQIAEAAKPVVDYLTGAAGWQMKMNELMADHQQQVDFNLKKQQEQLNIQIQIANLQTDRVVREEMLKSQQDEVVAKLQAQQELVDQLNRTRQQSANSFGSQINQLAESITGGLYNNNEDQQIVENILAEEQKRLDALRQQKEQLDQQLQVENEQVKAAREKLELEQQRQRASKTAEDELNKLRAEIRELRDPGSNEQRRVEEMFNADGVTEAQRMELENLRAIKAEEQELARIKQQAAEENKRAIEEQQKANKDAWAELAKQLADEQKARDSIQSEIEKAQKQLSDEQKRQDDELAKKMATPAPQLQAMQSRLLSRSGQSNTGERQAKANEKVAELTARIETLQREQQTLLSDIRNNTRNTIKVVS